MQANDLRARLLLIQGAVQECLEMLGGAEGLGAAASIELPKGSRACAHPESMRERMMGGYWMCDPLKGGCGERGHDTKGAP